MLCIDRPDNHQDYKGHSKSFEYWTCPVFRCLSYARLKLVSLAINFTLNTALCTQKNEGCFMPRQTR